MVNEQTDTIPPAASVSPTAHGGTDKRDPKTGRLLPGHSVNRGRPTPHAQKAAEWRHAFAAAVTPADITAVALLLVEKAKAGTQWAVEELLNRALGPSGKIDLNVGEGSSFQILIVPAEEAQRSNKPLFRPSDSPPIIDISPIDTEACEDPDHVTQTDSDGSGIQGGPQHPPCEAEEGGDDER